MFSNYYYRKFTFSDLCVELLNFLKNQSSKMQDEESEKKLSRPINAATIIHFWKRSFAEV